MIQGTIILPCTCQHEEQDKMYGKGRRVHNIAKGKDGKSTPLAFCTVCTPRNTSADKMAGGLDPMPHIGFKGTPPKNSKQGKPVPNR